MSVSQAVERFKRCKGPMTARRAETGEEAAVEAVEDRSDGHARLVIRAKDGREWTYEGSYVNGPQGLGDYFDIVGIGPQPAECELESFEIHDGGVEDYGALDGGRGCRRPVLALTISNADAAVRNAPIVAAWEAEQERRQEELRRKNDEARARRQSDRTANLKLRSDEIASRLNAPVTGVAVDGHDADHVHTLTLNLADGTVLTIRARQDRSLSIETIKR